MNDKRKTPGRSANLTGAAGGTSGETASNIDFTMSGPSGQAGKVSRLLLHGEQNAIAASDLATLAGYSNTRSLRQAIDRERENSVILASDKGYYKPQPGDTGLAEIRAFVKRMDSRMKSNRQAVRVCKRVLKQAAKAPLDGQESLQGRW